MNQRGMEYGGLYVDGLVEWWYGRLVCGGMMYGDYMLSNTLDRRKGRRIFLDSLRCSTIFNDIP